MLRSCSHYNTKAREDTLSGLKDLFQNNPGVLKDNLNAVLQQTLRLMTDIEGSVRNRLLGLLSLIFQSLSETEVSPFFANVVAYLCSAMTHLDESIRLDSLKFLDLCLECFPRLVKVHAKNIVLNFINVISMKKSDVVTNSRIPKKTQWKAKVMSQKTQLQVLSQMNHLLHVVCIGSLDQIKLNTQHSSSSDSNDVNTDGNHDHDVNSSTILKTPTSSSCVFDVQPVSNFSLKTASEFETSATSVGWLKEFVSSLVPVLFEYWVECCPAEFSVNLIPIKKVSVSLQIMKEILEILVTLVERCKKNTSDPEWCHSFLNNELGSLVQTHFTPVFPLSFTVQQSGRKSTAPSVDCITDVKLNILIAQVLTYYIGGNSSKSPSNVLGYLQDMLTGQMANRQLSKTNASDMKSVTSLLTQIYSLDMPEHLKDKKVQLLDVMFQSFESSHSATLKIWLDFLAKVVNDAKTKNESTVLILAKWLKSLLRILNKNTTEDLKYKILVICKSGIVQRFPHLADAMADELPRIFAVANFSKLSVKLQRLVIEILYHNDQVPSRELFGVLVELCNSGCLLLQVFEYLVFVIHQVVHSSPPASTLADYLSFILSITIGRTQKQLEWIETGAQGQPHCYKFEDISEVYTIVAEFENSNGDPQITNESWVHSTKVLEIICQLLAQSDYSSRFLKMLEVPLCKLFGKYPTLPLEVVYRLLYFVDQLFYLTKDGKAGDLCNIDLLTAIGTWCGVVWHFLLKLWAEFGKANFMETLASQLKAIMSRVCKSSEIILKNMLGLFIQCTAPGRDPQLTCEVLTDMLKELQNTLAPVHLPLLDVLYKNLDSAATKKMLNSRTFSCFDNQYQICKRKTLLM